MLAIAIDGPAGAGKSSIAKAVAKTLGFLYVDTGALYRAIGLFAVQRGIDPADAGALVPLLPNAHVELAYVQGEQRVLLDGHDVSREIRAPEMGMAASKVSAIPAVRDFLFDLQRDMARKNNVIMDGRDIGTVVLPDAQLKIFLTASAEARARRRYDEHIAKGEEVRYNIILEDMKQRDFNDENRAVAPLCRAPDAVLVDTSELTFEQSKQAVLDLIRSLL